MNDKLQDAEAIAEKVLHFLQLPPKDLMAYISKNQDEALHYISDPQKGMVFIGSEGTRRFRLMAKRFLKNQAEKRGRMDQDVFVECLKAEYLRRFIQQAGALNVDEVQRMIAAAFHATEKTFCGRRHFIPCAIFLSNKFPEIVVEPVRFKQSKHFIEANGAALDAHRGRPADRPPDDTQSPPETPSQAEPAAKKKESKRLSDMLVDRVLSHFGDYGWIAEVDVPPCSPRISYDRALFLTRAALNILKLILGRQHTYRLRTAEDRGHAPNSAKLSRNDKGQLQISALNSSDQNVLGDECLEALQKDFAEDLRQATIVLTHAASFADPPPLCRRFLDALSWYGDAVNEPSAAARIVKFVTAIEAICGTGAERDAQNKEVRGVTETVTRRAGILLQRWIDGSHADARAQVAQIYDWRSRLVHGSLSPFDEDLGEFSMTTEDVVRRILLTGLDYYTYLGITDPKFTMRPLREKFRELEKKAEETETNDDASKT